MASKDFPSIAARAARSCNGSPPVRTELVISEKQFQATQHIQLAAAIRTALRTTGMPQELHHIFHFRIIAKHPSGRHGTMVGGINQCQRISQLTRMLPDQHVHIGMRTDFPVIKTAYQPGQSPAHLFGFYQAKKPVELFLALQQRGKHLPFLFGQRTPPGHLIQEQVARLLAIVHRIVHLVAHQLVVLHQPVVRTLRKQQWRDIQRIHQCPAASPVGKQVFRIVMDDVVSAEVVRVAQEIKQLLLRCLMKSGTVLPKSPYIMNFMVFQSYLYVHKGITRGLVFREYIPDCHRLCFSSFTPFHSPYLVKAPFHSTASVCSLKLLNTRIKHFLQMYK